MDEKQITAALGVQETRHTQNSKETRKLYTLVVYIDGRWLKLQPLLNEVGYSTSHSATKASAPQEQGINQNSQTDI